MLLESLLLNSSVTATLTSYCLVPNAKDNAKKSYQEKKKTSKKDKWLTFLFTKNPAWCQWVKKKNTRYKDGLRFISMVREPWMFSGEWCPSNLFQDRRGYYWWMWTLHPSMPKAQAHPKDIFLLHILNSPLSLTYQCSLASTDTDSGATREHYWRFCIATRWESVYVKESWSPCYFYFVLFFLRNRECNVHCHWCSFTVYFCALSSRDWIMAFYMLSAQLSH